jgi:hypothetical protein
VLAQLQTKDQEAFNKLTDKTLSRLTSDNLLSSTQATGLAMNLLRPGPQIATTTTLINHHHGNCKQRKQCAQRAGA